MDDVNERSIRVMRARYREGVRTVASQGNSGAMRHASDFYGSHENREAFIE
jgi:hypothetical protein